MLAAKADNKTASFFVRTERFAEPPLKENDVDCDHYWPTEDRRARDKS